MAEAPELSAILLGYRSGTALVPLAERLHASLERSGHSFELVLVANYDEGSEDPTPEVAAGLAERHAGTRVVASPKRGGMGWDLRSGLDAAIGDVLVVIDGDGQYDPDDVVRAFQVLRESGAQVVTGRRTSRGDGLLRRVVTIAYNLTFLLLFPRRAVWDVNGKPKALTRAAYQRLDLVSDDWFLDAELLLEARRVGHTVRQLPVAYSTGSRASFVKPGAILEFARHMVRYRLTGRV